MKVLKAYAIGDVAFFAEWKEESGVNVWVKLQYAGYSKDGSLFFQWLRGSKHYGDIRGAPIPVATAVHEMRVEIVPLESNYATALWRVGPGQHDTINVYYALGDQGELLEIEPEKDRPMSV